jgi:hypothetical protein
VGLIRGCGSKLPPWFGEACFADLNLTDEGERINGLMTQRHEPTFSQLLRSGLDFGQIRGILPPHAKCTNREVCNGLIITRN